MSTATFPRLHTWGPNDVVLGADLNAEFNNVLNNLNPPGMGSYSDTAATMKIQTSPGAVGSESLATSLAGELERLRYQLAQIIGATSNLWYAAVPASLTGLVNAVGSSSLGSRIVSGPTTGNSSQLQAFFPVGTAASVVLSASGTPLVYVVGGVNYTISTNATITGLSLGPGNNATGSNSSGLIASQQWTKGLGQYGTGVPLANIGAINLTGQYVAFQHGATAEYFIGVPISGIVGKTGATAMLTNCWRGCFHNSAGGILTQPIADSEVYTQMKLAWIFAGTNLSLAVTYNNPAYQNSTPTSPASGDYWFNLNTSVWMTYGSQWNTANATLVGMCVQNATACVGARTFDSYVSANSLSTVNVDFSNATAAQARGPFSQLQVFGTKLNFGDAVMQWTTTGLDTNVTLSGTLAYFYVKESGAQIVSDVMPMQRRDLGGLYHPRETWRCVGVSHLNGSSQFTTPVRTFRGDLAQNMGILEVAAYEIGNPTSGGIIGYAIQGSGNNLLNVLTAVNTNQAVSASNVTAAYATVSLTPGIWSMNLQMQYGCNTGSCSSCAIVYGIGTDTAAFSDGQIGFNQMNAGIGVTGQVQPNLPLPLFIYNYIVTVNTASQNFYAILSTTNNVTANGPAIIKVAAITAVRLDAVTGGPT